MEEEKEEKTYFFISIIKLLGRLVWTLDKNEDLIKTLLEVTGTICVREKTNLVLERTHLIWLSTVDTETGKF